MEQNTNNRQPSPPKKSARPKITVFSPLPGQEKNESADPTKETIDSAILTDDSASEVEPPADEKTAESGDTAEEAPAAPEASTFNVGLTVTRRTLSGEDTKKEKPQDQKKTDPQKREKRAVTEKKDEPKKKRLRVVHGAPPRKTDDGAETEHVFLRMAKKLRIVKYGVALCLIAFVSIMLTFFSDAITMENLRYMARYLDIGSSYSGFSDTYVDLTYQTSTRHDFSVYRGDIAVSGAVGLQIKSTTNRDIFSADLYYFYPVSCTGAKQILVYDLGSTGFSVHNTFSTLYSGTTDYAITAADMSDSGTFALVTGSAQYRSEVTVYDSDFEVICSVKKDKTVVDISLSPDGSHLLVLSCGTADSEFYSEIMICNTKSGETEYTETLNGQFAATADYRADGTFTIFTDASVLFYGADFGLITAYAPLKTPTAYCMQNGYTTLAVSHSLVGGDSTVTVLDALGTTVCTAEITGKIIRMSAAQNALCVLTADQLIYIPYRGGKVSSLVPDGSPSDFLLCSDAGGYICYQSGAQYISFAEAFAADGGNN